jgi:phosphatidylglycerophosphate synthase
MSHQPPTSQVEDRELLLGFYKRLLWDRLVTVLPARITPNAITLFGQAAAVFACIAAIAGVHGYPVGFLVSAGLLLTFLTADNVDGAHARRTGQASPLGEVLDHGLDGIGSGAVLIATAVVVRLPGVWLTVWVVLGALMFIALFWEQYRTGRLIIPAVSSTEGITALVIIEVLAFSFDDPKWLQFSLDEPNVATVALIIAVFFEVIALAAPAMRVHRASGRLVEFVPAVVIGLVACGYAVAGADPIVPAILIVAFSADVVCRTILHRHQGTGPPLVSREHGLLVAPLAGAFLGSGMATPTQWALLATALALGIYARTLAQSISLIRAM